MAAAEGFTFLEDFISINVVSRSRREMFGRPSVIGQHSRATVLAFPVASWQEPGAGEVPARMGRAATIASLIPRVLKFIVPTDVLPASQQAIVDTKALVMSTKMAMVRSSLSLEAQQMHVVSIDFCNFYVSVICTLANCAATAHLSLSDQ